MQDDKSAADSPYRYLIDRVVGPFLQAALMKRKTREAALRELQKDRLAGAARRQKSSL